MEDWFRKRKWTATDEAEFFRRLGRAREWSRSRYLRIQAHHLVDCGEPNSLNAAEMLIKKLFAEYPEDKIQRSSAFALLANIYRFRQQYDEAIELFIKAIDFEKEYANVKTTAFLDFAELVVKRRIREYYRLAEELLEERRTEFQTREMAYRMNSIRAIILSEKGDKMNAKQYAALAEQAANSNTSGLMYHQTLGLVVKRDMELDKLMARI